MALPRILKRFNVFHSGLGYAGIVEEIELPKLVAKTEELQTGGMGAAVKVNMGLDELQLTHKYAGLVPEIIKNFCTSTIDGESLRFAGAYQRDDTGEVQAVEITMRGRQNEHDFGSAQAGEKNQTSVVTDLTYFKLTIDNEDVVEIDLLNDVFIVGGDDRWQGLREAIQ